MSGFRGKNPPPVEGKGRSSGDAMRTPSSNSGLLDGGWSMRLATSLIIRRSALVNGPPLRSKITTARL